MNILMVLPEFDEGGVERHVLWLSAELAALGHSVSIATAGGRLEEKLPPEVRVVRLPVHRKNPFTALFSALRIAALAWRDEIDVIHAHSRVPAWIACWASGLSGKPWVFTAHARYRKNAGIRPFRKADGAICVSEAVRSHLEGFLPARTVVIRNGIPEPSARWQKREEPGPFRFLFVGRLTRLKGLQVVLSALTPLSGESWVLDILGDGPQREELEGMAKNLGLRENVRFQGFRDDVERWMVSSDCLLFPSLDEGMPLVLMQAIRVGIPVLASRIPPVIELTGKRESLLPPGDADAWGCGLSRILREGKEPPRFDPSMVPLARQMAEQTGCFLERIAVGKNAGKA